MGEKGLQITDNFWIIVLLSIFTTMIEFSIYMYRKTKGYRKVKISWMDKWVY